MGSRLQKTQVVHCAAGIDEGMGNAGGVQTGADDLIAAVHGISCALGRGTERTEVGECSVGIEKGLRGLG